MSAWSICMSCMEPTVLIHLRDHIVKGITDKHAPHVVVLLRFMHKSYFNHLTCTVIILSAYLDCYWNICTFLQLYGNCSNEVFPTNNTELIHMPTCLLNYKSKA